FIRRKSPRFRNDDICSGDVAMNILEETKRPGSVMSHALDSPSKAAIPSADNENVSAGRGASNRVVHLEDATSSSRATIDKNDAGIIQLESFAECLDLRHRRWNKLWSDGH